MDNLLNEPGLQLTILFFFIPVFFALILILIKINSIISNVLRKKELKKIYEDLKNLQPGEVAALEKRKIELEFKLIGNELSLNNSVEDPRGLVDQTNEIHDIRFLQTKRKERKNIVIPNNEKKLILWFGYPNESSRVRKGI
ncbi:hypothetical protein OBK23_07560 [Empedobacter falsenii]|uniref:hypothetical protein n=1 Tax=Empedobacter falsenii TaxID=343874 RepID=UPI003A80D508